MTPKVTFLISGLGLGNSTRCHAIIQCLAEQGVDVDIVTSGNGLWYFEGRPEVRRIDEIESLYYAKTKTGLSIAATLASAGALMTIQRRIAKRVTEILENHSPDVVVVDSIYTYRPVRRMGLPLVALNNADVVVHSYRRFDDRPPSIRAQFHFVERMDCLFHKIIPNLVLSPTLIPSLPQFGGHFHRINPIVRRGYESDPPATPPRKIVIMLSGSIFTSPIILARTDYPVTIDIIGCDAPADWKPVDGVRYLGKVRDTREILADADLAVVNGGFSAVSEMVCMRKPVIVIPVPRHAEQWVNARTIEHLGFGLMATDDNFEEVMLSALDRIGDFRAAYDARGPIGDGAAEAAFMIIETAKTARA